MPSLEFKGKSHSYAHHMGVPYRPPMPDAARPARQMQEMGLQHGQRVQRPITTVL